LLHIATALGTLRTLGLPITALRLAITTRTGRSLTTVTAPLRLTVGGASFRPLPFRVPHCHLAMLDALDYAYSPNIAVRILTALMDYPSTPEDRVRVYGQAWQGLLELEPDPDQLVKYLGIIHTYLKLDTTEQQLYARLYPQEKRHMNQLAESWIEKGWQKGRQEGILLGEQAGKLSGRQETLAEQLADLKSSRADLLRIVEEIDTRVQEVFSQAFEDTARQFASVFDRLFPGGEGRLVLTDPGDMLTTGVEIEARPAGKKVKRLSLLSGGERSLAAVALLVAIFKARPSPFYVMDEVEAALDDTNLGRLLEIFTELRQSSQLIIITHQKRTMEVADALYGITMRDGITKAVSQRLAQPDHGTAVTPDV